MFLSKWRANIILSDILHDVFINRRITIDIQYIATIITIIQYT